MQPALTLESVEIVSLPHFLNFFSRIVHCQLVNLQIHPLEPPTLNTPTYRMLVMETGWFKAQCSQGVRLQADLNSNGLWLYLFNVQDTVDSRDSNSSISSTFKEHPHMSSKQDKLVCGWFITDDTREYVPSSVYWQHCSSKDSLWHCPAQDKALLCWSLIFKVIQKKKCANQNFNCVPPLPA